MNIPTKTTNAYFIQCAISFAVAMCAVLFGVLYLPVDGWIRAFLGLGALYLVTSSFGLAKCVRDQQENNAIYSRVDQARVDKLLSEHDLLAS